MRVPPKIKRELARLGKRTERGVSSYAADVLIAHVKQVERDLEAK